MVSLSRSQVAMLDLEVVAGGLASAVGRRLAAARERLAWSPLRLADRAGVDVGRVHAIEHGRSLPTVGESARMAEALGIEEVALLWG